MTVVLDSGGLTAVAHSRSRVASLRKKGAWPPIVPTAVLVESLTGDHRKDFHTSQILRRCVVRDLTEIIARHAALLRYKARQHGTSAVDAIVTATADHAGGGVVLTSDPQDISALAAHTIHPVGVSAV